MSTRTSIESDAMSEERIDEVAREAMEALKERFDPTSALSAYRKAQHEYNANVKYNKQTMPHTVFLTIPSQQRSSIKVIMPVLKNFGVATMDSTGDGGTSLTFNTDNFDSLFDIQLKILQMAGKCNDQDIIQTVLPGGTFESSPKSNLQMEATMYWLRMPTSMYLDVCVKLIKRYQEGFKTSHIALHVIDPEDSGFEAGKLYEAEPTDFHEGPPGQRRSYQMVMSVKKFCDYQKNIDFGAPLALPSPSAPASSPSKKTPKRMREAKEEGEAGEARECQSTAK
jgi:hypothetical protein